ncbi:MAG: hypothetical protein LCH26_00150 [Proteobacteria bacterium]|nr:hypothetical protein [Pseudomonadota bacterium]
MRRFKKILYSSLFGSLLLTASSYGAVPDAAFKGVTRHFKKKYFSPTVGRVALDHLIPNIRFHWGVQEPNDDDQDDAQERRYINDKSDDPLWRVTRVLFPSVDGNLGDTVGGDTNHQHFSNYVESPKTVALLMCYVEDVRTAIQNHLAQVSTLRLTEKYSALDEGRVTKAHQKRLEELKKSYGQRIKESLSYQEFSSAHLNPFLADIALAVSHEEVSASPLPAQPVRAPKKRETRSPSPDVTGASSSGAAPSSSGTAVANDAQEIKTLAPVHTIEQVILGFLCFHFDKQEDLWGYMEEMQRLQSAENKIIEDTFTNPHGSNLFDDEKDLALLMEKQDGPQDSAFDLDDIYNLVRLTKGTSVPYTNVLSNGRAWVYDRANDSFYAPKGALQDIQGLISLRARQDGVADFLRIAPLSQDGRLEVSKKHFADCGEMTIRHIFNFILYDQKTHKFDLDHLKSKGIQNPYIQHLFDFFQIQSDVHTAKSGSPAMRSLWNRVVGDLNHLPEGHTGASTSTQSDSVIRYGSDIKNSGAGTHDLETDFENILNVFEKILGFGLTPFKTPENPYKNPPEFQNSDEEEAWYEALEVWEQNSYAEESPHGAWLEEQFDKLLTFLNPHHTYRISSRHYLDGERLYGKLSISVNDAFKFTLDMDRGHGEISKLKLAKENDIGPVYTQKLKALLEDQNLVPQGSVESSLISFASAMDPHLAQKESLFSSLMGHDFEGNSHITAFVLGLLAGDLASYSDEVMGTLDHTLAGLLKEFTWRDRASVDQISPSLIQLAAKTARLPLAFASVKTLSGKPTSSTADHLQLDISVFKGAKTLELLEFPIERISITQDMPQLEKLSIPVRTKEVTGLEHLVARPSMNIHSESQLQALRAHGSFFPKDNWMFMPEQLETIEGVHHLQIDELNLSRTNVKELVVEGDNWSLEALTLNPGKTKTSGLGHFKELKTLSLRSPTGLERGDEISFTEDMPAVETLILDDAYLSYAPVALRGLEDHFPNLKILEIEGRYLGQKGLMDLLRIEQISTLFIQGTHVNLTLIPDHIKNVLIQNPHSHLRGRKSEWEILRHPDGGILDPEDRDKPGRRLYMTPYDIIWEET